MHIPLLGKKRTCFWEPKRPVEKFFFVHVYCNNEIITVVFTRRGIAIREIGKDSALMSSAEETSASDKGCIFILVFQFQVDFFFI